MEGWLTDCNTDTNWSKYTHVIPMPIHNTAWAMERSVLSGREVSDHHRIMPPGQSAKLIHWPACLAQSALRIVKGGSKASHCCNVVKIAFQQSKALSALRARFSPFNSGFAQKARKTPRVSGGAVQKVYTLSAAQEERGKSAAVFHRSVLSHKLYNAIIVTQKTICV